MDRQTFPLLGAAFFPSGSTECPSASGSPIIISNELNSDIIVN